MNKIFNLHTLLKIMFCAMIFHYGTTEAHAFKFVECIHSESVAWYSTGGSNPSKELQQKVDDFNKIVNEFNAFCKSLHTNGLRKEKTFEYHDQGYLTAINQFLDEHPSLKEKYDQYLQQYNNAKFAVIHQDHCDKNPSSKGCMDDATFNDLQPKYKTAQSDCNTAFTALTNCGGKTNLGHSTCSNVAVCDDDFKITKGNCSDTIVNDLKNKKDQLCSLGRQLMGQNYGTLQIDMAANDTSDYYAYAPTSAWKDSELADAYKGSLLEAGVNARLAEANDDPRSNSGYCDIAQLKKDYMSNCYSCTIVAVMINTFLTVAEKTAPLTQQAGITLMIIGMFLWIAFYILKQIASFVAPEPMQILQDLMRFLFKCFIAYVLITSSLGVISKMIVNPILGFGAEYGNLIIDISAPKATELDKYGKFDIKEYNSQIISKEVFGKIMSLSKKADASVSLNFVIGDAVSCHAHHAGAIMIAKKIQEKIGLEFYFPDIWLWLCGIAIWFMGFMVVIAINFYLLDLSFKIGFGLLALPITIGLWPFDKFQDKFTDCIKIIANAAGTFMFLGITVGISIALISSALGGTDALFDAIDKDNKRYVAEQFSLAGAKFLLVAFAFLYSHKLISETVSNLTRKFFDSVTSGMNHMHTMAVGTTSYMGRAVKDKVGGTVGRVTNMVGKGVDKLSGAVGGGLRKGGRAVGRGFKRLAGRG